MSTKEFHTTRLYVSHLRRLSRQIGRAVSAGEVAKYAGVSRTTARKYLEKAVSEGLAQSVQGECKNGMLATGYLFGEDALKWKS